MSKQKVTEAARSAPRTARLAKVTRPSVGGLLPRERLFGVLDDASAQRCVWVSAQGGAGKTSLVSSWLEVAADRHSVWYQVDAGDSDPATLFHYLRVALEATGENRGLELPRFTPEALPSLDVFACRFFEAFFAAVATPFVLVFDNFQEAHGDSLFHTAIAGALSALPPGAVILCISREDPPHALSRWTADAGFCRLSFDDLRLTSEEAQAMGHLAKTKVTHLELQSMNARARGWAAGLRLLLGAQATGVTIAGQGDATSQALFGYFANEIFNGMPGSTRDILLDTSVLPNVTAEWASALSGQEDAGNRLAELHRRRLFIERRPGTHSVASYEYHPLFHQFLLERARRERSTEEFADLQRRAARLLEGAGDVEGAANLWQATEAWSDLARVAREHASTLLGQGRLSALEGWILSVPELARKEDAWLWYWLGCCRTFRAPALGRPSLTHAYASFRAAGDSVGAFLALGAIFRGYFFEWGAYAGIDPWVQEFEQLLAEAGGVIPEAAEVEVLRSCIGLAFRSADHPLIPRLVQRAEALARSLSDPDQRLSVAAFALQHLIWVGEHSRARALCEELSVDAARAAMYSRCELAAWRGVLLWFDGELDTAAASWTEVLELSEQSGVLIHVPAAHQHLAMVAFSAGDLDAAARGLDAAWPLISPERVAERQHHHLLRSILLVLSGRRAEALSVAREAVRLCELGAGSRYLAAVYGAIFAQVLMANGEHVEAREQLGQVLDFSRRMASEFLEFHAELAIAWSYLASEDDAAAVVHLRQALAIGKARNYKSCVMLWLPEHLSRLCARALEAGIETEYVRGLVRQRGLTPESPDIETWPWPLRVYTLGRFSLLIDDKPLEFVRKAQKKPLELLKAIIARGGRGVDHSALVEDLWPDLDGDAARNALDLALHRLRKLLKSDDAIRVHDGKLELDSSRVWVDTWLFERQCGEGCRAGAQSAEPTRLLDLSERLLRLYQGPFLGSEAAPWIVTARARLQSKFLRAISNVGELLERQRAWDQSIVLYRRAIEIEPLAEEFHRRVMSSYRAQGRPAEALNAYRQCREVLSGAFGIEPSAATRAIYETVICVREKASLTG